MKDFFDRFGSLLFLIFLILVKAALLILFIHSESIGLGPDEAQYWTWSKNLSFGYYSKPPGIAWQIFLGTLYAGDTELGVRLLSVVIGSLYPLLIYFLAWSLGLNTLACFFAGLMMAFIPLGVMGSFFAITDVGMLLFWILACLSASSSIAQNKIPRYYLIGFFIALGALFKWPIYILWIFILLFWSFNRFMISKHAIGGFIISLLGMIPALIWNIYHEFSTFRHVFSTIYVPKAVEPSLNMVRGNFLDFFGAQAALVSPILFALLLLSVWFIISLRKEINSGLLFCGTITFSLLFIFLIASVFKKMQGNWVAYAYPTGLVFMAWVFTEKYPQCIKWVKSGLVLSLFLCALVLSYPSLQRHLPLKTPFKINPFKHNLGWDVLKEELKNIGYDPNEHFLFSDTYQMTSILSFYSEEQKLAYFFNIHGLRKNQFSFWPSMKTERLGKTGFFVVCENAPHNQKWTEEGISKVKNLLQPYFEEIEFLEKKPLFTVDAEPVKEALFFKCINYNGLEPEETQLY